MDNNNAYNICKTLRPISVQNLPDGCLLFTDNLLKNYVYDHHRATTSETLNRRISDIQATAIANLRFPVWNFSWDRYVPTEHVGCDDVLARCVKKYEGTPHQKAAEIGASRLSSNLFAHCIEMGLTTKGLSPGRYIELEAGIFQGSPVAVVDFSIVMGLCGEVHRFKDSLKARKQ